MVAPQSTLQEIAEISTWPNEALGIAAFLMEALKAPTSEWKRIYKALHVVEYLLSNGSHGVISSLQGGYLHVRYLCDFVYSGDRGDRGESIRTKAKLVYGMLTEGPDARREAYSSFDVARGSCFSKQPNSGYVPPSTLSFADKPQSSPVRPQEESFRPPPKRTFQPEVVYQQPVPPAPSEKSVDLFAKLSKPKPQPSKIVDLLAVEDTRGSGKSEAGKGLDLISFDAVGSETNTKGDLLRTEPVATAPLAPPPIQVFPSQPAAMPFVSSSPTASLPKSSPTLPPAPRISHNMAPATQQPAFELPSKPAPKKSPALDLDSLMSSLDNLREETEKGKTEPKKPQFVINI